MADGSVIIDSELNDKGLEKGLSDLQKKVENTGKKMQSVGTNLTKYATLPIMALGTAAFAASDTIEKAYRNIQIGTGATGEALEDLKQSFDNVFVDVPNSAEEVSNALAILNTHTGATSTTLEELTTNVLDASRMLGEDGVTNAENFGEAMRMWQVPAEEGTERLDELFKLTQDFGVGLGEVSGSLTTYGAVMKNAGFEMGESAEFMARLESNGISVSRVMPGLNSAFRRWAGEGKNSREELDRVIGSIRNAETDMEALTIATEEFGAEGAQRLMTGIRNGAIPSLDELGNVLDDTNGLVQQTNEDTMTVGDHMMIMKNVAMTALQPIGDIIIDLAKNIIPVLTDTIKTLSDWFNNLSPEIQRAIVVVGGIIAAIGPLIAIIGTVLIVGAKLMAAFAAINPVVLLVVAAIGAVIAIGVALAQNWDTVRAKAVEVFSHFEPLLEVVRAAFQKLMDSVGPILESLKSLWESLVPLLQTVGIIIGSVLAAAFGILVGVINGAIAAIGPLINAIINLIDFVVNMVNVVVALLTGDFAGAWEYLKTAGQSVVDFFINAFEGLINFIMGFVDGVIGFFQGLYNTLVGNSIIPDMVNAIVQWFQNMFQWVIDIVMNIVSGIVNAFTNIYQTVSNIVQSVLNIITSIFSAILGFIITTLSNIFSNISNVFSNIFSTISNVMSNISNTILTIFNAVSGTIRNVTNGIRDTISNIFNSLRGIVSNAFNSVKNAVSNGMSNALGAVTSMLGNFTNAGGNIVRNIASGIRGAIGSVTSAISSVTQKIRNFLPFSPAKEGPLDDLNKLDFKGPVTDSLDDAIPDVQAKMNTMLEVPTMQPPRVEPRFRNDSIRNDSNGTPIQVTSTVNLDGEQIASVVYDPVNTRLGRDIDLEAYMRGGR